MNDATTAASERLFSYGTLQLEAVQLATFGRRLQGRPAQLVGYRIQQLEIRDPTVVATSGLSFHPQLVASGDPTDRVTGTAFLLTPAELAQADAYEVSDYQRVEARLESGEPSWVYVAAGTEGAR